MKKFVTFIAASFLMSSFFISLPVSATESQVDQSCGLVSGTTTIWRPNGLSQYFKPTLNHLTKVAVKVQTMSRHPASYILIIRNSLGQQIYTQGFDLNSNENIVGMPTNNFDIEVTTGSLYSIQLVHVTDDLYWAYTQNKNCNTGGYASLDSSYDMAFYTYGYNVASLETPPASPPPSSSEGSTESSGTTATTTTTSTSAGSTAQATLSVDANIKKPELKVVEKDNNRIDIPVEDKVSISDKNKLTIIGTSTPGTSVVVFVGDTAYNATIDKDGLWLVSLDGAKIKEGEYSIQAQAQKDGKGSEKADLFKLAASKERATAQSTPADKSFDMNKFYLAGLITVLILLCVLLYLENKRVKRLSKKSQPKTIKSKSREIK